LAEIPEDELTGPLSFLNDPAVEEIFGFHDDNQKVGPFLKNGSPQLSIQGWDISTESLFHSTLRDFVDHPDAIPIVQSSFVWHDRESVGNLLKWPIDVFVPATLRR
jgi:hypothetical protein